MTLSKQAAILLACQTLQQVKGEMGVTFKGDELTDFSNDSAAAATIGLYSRATGGPMTTFDMGVATLPTTPELCQTECEKFMVRW